MSPTRCPYCGKKISYFKAFFIRRRGEYFCKKCKKESNIHIKKTIWLFFIVVLLMSLAIMGYYIFFTDRENLWFLLYVAIPFIIFYLFSPLFVRLRPKMKFQDSLYDTEMVDNANDPDPTMQKTAKVVPTFVDDVILGDDDYKPSINSDIFNAIKEERKVVGEQQYVERYDAGRQSEGYSEEGRNCGGADRYRRDRQYPLGDRRRCLSCRYVPTAARFIAIRIQKRRL